MVQNETFELVPSASMESQADRESRSSRASDSPGDTMNDVYAAWREYFVKSKVKLGI